MTETKQTEQAVENQTTEESYVNDATSLELLWKMGFDELDVWLERYNKRDERFLESVINYVEKIKENQGNLMTVAAQFSVELKDWEKATREELLATTTPLQHFFPVKSYEEINQVVEDIQNKTAHLLLTPVQALTTAQFQALDQYIATVKNYIAYRKNAREKYIESVKKTSNVLYENQKQFINLFTNQVKTLAFPFQKYMKNAADYTKSK